MLFISNFYFWNILNNLKMLFILDFE